MSSQLWSGQAFCVSHADGSGTFKSNFTGGLRAFFEYRNLGVDDATQGKYSANVIRAVPGRHAEPAWHIHHLDFQMIYICLLYTSPSPRDKRQSRMPSSA